MITLSEFRQKLLRTASSQQKGNSMKKKSIYRLLVQSEEKSRNILETALYGLFAISAMVTIWQFAEQPAALPTHGTGTVLKQSANARIAS